MMRGPQIVKPCKDRQETNEKLEGLGTRSHICNVWGEGPLILSNIPETLLHGANKAVMGIDEAGRGPVLGPMVYSAAFWAADSDEEMSKQGFDDSKTLTHLARSKIFDKIRATDNLGFVVRVLHASEISRNMLNAIEPYNLNAMSHDAAITMIRTVIQAGVKLERVFIDTVGTPESYQAKLERIFEGNGIQFIVEKKADSKYASCSAASICAKVLRDELTTNWKWSEPHYEPASNEKDQKVIGFGSGYPSDPQCKKWMDKNFCDSVFGYPDFVRFSWAPAKEAVVSRGALIEWEADEDIEHTEIDGQQTMSEYFSTGQCWKKRRLKLFQDLDIQSSFRFTF